MNFRMATLEDLSYLKQMYRDIVANMKQHNIHIWDDVYPCEFLKNDIVNQVLYVMTNENGKIVSACALCDSNQGESDILWESTHDKACYIDRLGVNISFKRQGIASQMLEFAVTRAKELGCTCLRLFVVDSNSPAIKLYQKNGFSKKDGVFYEKIDEQTTLCEFGFERKL